MMSNESETVYHDLHETLKQSTLVAKQFLRDTINHFVSEVNEAITEEKYRLNQKSTVTVTVI